MIVEVMIGTGDLLPLTNYIVIQDIQETRGWHAKKIDDRLHGSASTHHPNVRVINPIRTPLSTRELLSVCYKRFDLIVAGLARWSHRPNSKILKWQ